MTIRVLDPTLERPAAAGQPAPRLRSLVGVTVGLLDNGKVNVGRFLDHVEALLYAGHGVRDVVRRRKGNMSAPADAATLAALAACDGVISAVGD